MCCGKQVLREHLIEFAKKNPELVVAEMDLSANSIPEPNPLELGRSYPQLAVYAAEDKWRPDLLQFPNENSVNAEVLEGFVRQVLDRRARKSAKSEL